MLILLSDFLLLSFCRQLCRVQRREYSNICGPWSTYGAAIICRRSSALRLLPVYITAAHSLTSPLFVPKHRKKPPPLFEMNNGDHSWLTRLGRDRRQSTHPNLNISKLGQFAHVCLKNSSHATRDNDSDTETMLFPLFSLNRSWIQLSDSRQFCTTETVIQTFSPNIFA